MDTYVVALYLCATSYYFTTRARSKLRKRLPAKYRIFGSFGPLILMIVFAAVNYAYGQRSGLEGHGACRRCV
jgi:hypothetical protein